MRILVHDYAGHAFPIDLSRELARRGHSVWHVFASNLVTPRGDLQKRVDDPDALHFHEVPMHPRYPEWKYSFVRRRRVELDYGKKLATLTTTLAPDVVLSGNTPTDIQRLLLASTHATGGRFISWVQDFYGIAIEKLVRRKLGPLGIPIGAYYRRLDKKILRRSDYVIVITDDFTPLVQAEGVPRTKITTIPNWAILNEIASLPKSNDWARAQQMDDKFVFLYSGTLGMKHNPALLADLARSLPADGHARVVVVSQGPGADWLAAQKQANPTTLRHLLLLPYQSFSTLPSMLASGDVLLAVLEPDAGVFSVPSKVLSYFCAGRAMLLAMPRENLSARIADGAGAAHVVAPDDTTSFITSAHCLMKNDALRQKMGDAARKYAEAAFPIAAIAEKFEAVLCLVDSEKRHFKRDKSGQPFDGSV